MCIISTFQATEEKSIAETFPGKFLHWKEAVPPNLEVIHANSK